MVSPSRAQSTLLTAIEDATPAPVLSALTSVMTGGVAVLWSDPTADPRATGLFFGMSRGSYASVDMYHAVTAFRLGPRWSAAVSSVSLGNLFDSSLTNQDPTLSSLHAQAMWGRLDATLEQHWMSAAIGLGWAADDNVGAFQSSTIARAHLRVVPFPSRSVTIGLHADQTIGGSVQSRRGGRHAIDVSVKQRFGAAAVSFSIGGSRGALWRFSETVSGCGAGAYAVFLDQLEIGAALGRYTAKYGPSGYEWIHAVSAAVRVRSVRFGARYTSTRLGIGSGFALSLEYGPRTSAQR